MTFQQKVIKELGFGMGMDHEEDIAFAGMWVSRRISDGRLTSTYCVMWDDDELITDELRHEMADALRHLAQLVENAQ